MKNYVVLCNGATEEPYYKVNFEGVITGRIVTVKEFPYILELMACAVIVNPPIQIPISIGLWKNKKLDQTGHIDAQIDNSLTQIMLCVKFQISIESESQCVVRFTDSNNKILCEREFSVTLGDSPVINISSKQISSIIVSPSNSHQIDDIVNRSRKSIVIIDNYPSENEWNQILRNRSNVKIRIIIGRKEAEGDCKLLQQKFLDFSYKLVSHNNRPYFHDRFLVIDDTEFYHIGQSLKDVGKSVGRISRLISKDEINELRNHIVNQWSTIYS